MSSPDGRPSALKHAPGTPGKKVEGHVDPLGGSPVCVQQSKVQRVGDNVNTSMELDASQSQKSGSAIILIDFAVYLP